MAIRDPQHESGQAADPQHELGRAADPQHELVWAADPQHGLGWAAEPHEPDNAHEPLFQEGGHGVVPLGRVTDPQHQPGWAAEPHEPDHAPEPLVQEGSHGVFPLLLLVVRQLPDHDFPLYFPNVLGLGYSKVAVLVLDLLWLESPEDFQQRQLLLG
jgi:hypothetical protein